METVFANRNRFLIEALRRIAAEREIEMSSFSHDWIVQLCRNRVRRFVYGYNFDLNPSAASLVANDKCALSDILTLHKIPHVEHELFLAPELSGYISSDGNWYRAMQFVERVGYPLVCKDNQGTGGNMVFRVENQRELEGAFQQIHTLGRGLALSPYYPIDAEYRIILLDGSELFSYEKQQPYVLGDGQSTYYQLIQSKFSHDSELCRVALTDPVFPLHKTPDKDSKISLIWKHNLGKGAVPLFNLEPTVCQSIFELSRKALVSTGLRFACVDVVKTNGEMRVLEVNAGVMLESVSRYSEEGYKLALNVYARAVDAMFDQENPVG